MLTDSLQPTFTGEIFTHEVPESHHISHCCVVMCVCVCALFLRHHSLKLERERKRDAVNAFDLQTRNSTGLHSSLDRSLMKVC